LTNFLYESFLLPRNAEINLATKELRKVVLKIIPNLPITASNLLI